MKRPQHTNPRQRQGFSITELLVSISIIALLIGIVYPVISIMNTSSRVEAGLNIVGMASDVARQWVQAESWANDASTDASGAVNEQYSGTAALYCPTGEIRIVVNDRNARANSGLFVEDFIPEQNGYRDISKVDYIKIPNGAGVVGIYKDPSSGNVRFIAPPFAIAFNELGQLNYGDADGYIYYDGDGLGTLSMGIGGKRPANYNPSQWSGDRDENGTDPKGQPNFTSALSLTLPFEAIECVSGVVIYGADEYAESGYDFNGDYGGVTLTSSEGQWLKKNGTTVFFSPHTGVVLRDEEQD